MEDRITPQARPLDVLITALCKFHLRKKIDMVDTRSNMQIYDLNYKPRGGNILRIIIDHAIGSQLYTPGSVHYKLFFLGQFHDPLT